MLQEARLSPTDADIVTDRERRRPERIRVPERTVGALATSAAWLVAELICAAMLLAFLLVHTTRGGDILTLILAEVFGMAVGCGLEYRQQLWLARRGVLVDGVIERRARPGLGFLDPGWKDVRVRFVTARGSTRSCRMTVQRAVVGERVLVRHDPWWPWGATWGPSGGELVFLVVARFVGSCLCCSLVLLCGAVAATAMR